MGWAAHPGGVLHKDGPDEAGSCVGVSIGTTGRRNYRYYCIATAFWGSSYGEALAGLCKERLSITDDQSHVISSVS